MSAIHTQLTGKEDSYEQAVREAGERDMKYPELTEDEKIRMMALCGEHYIKPLSELDKKIGDFGKYVDGNYTLHVKALDPSGNEICEEKNNDNVFYRIGMDMLSYYKADTETMTPNHPDYMRLVVHQMD